MRRLLVAFFFTSAIAPLWGQVGNEWIQSGQAYFKIPIAREGIYRLTYSDLQNAGFPVAGDPRNIRLYHRGSEQALLIPGEGDGALQPGEYLEFFGRGNDGALDAQLYSAPSFQPHQYYNLYNDTTAYFLTLGSSAGKRMAVSNVPNPGTVAETFHWDEKLLVLKDQYSAGADYGSIHLSTFDQGEGFMGAQILQGQTGSYVIEGIVNRAESAGVPQLSVLLTGRGPMDHVVEVSAGGRLLGTANFAGFASTTFSAVLQWADISPDGKVTINVRVVGTGGPDRASVGFIRLRYPQTQAFTSGTEKVFTLAENANNVSAIEIASPPANARIFDITDVSSVVSVAASQTAALRAVVANTASARRLFVTNQHHIPAIKRVTFRSINPAAANYVIVTHPLLRKPASGYIDPVKAYAEYRSLPAGGGFDTLVVNIGQLYDQFSYGEKTSLAIYNFVRFLGQSGDPKFLFLIGKGLDVYYNYWRSPQSYPTYKDLVPTAGYPASDIAFSASGLDAHKVATGRLTASSPHDVAAYFNKVKEHESRPFDDLRRKNLLHLSGGIYEGEPQLFRGYLRDYEEIAESFYLGGSVRALAKQSTDIAVVNVADEVNDGVSLITFFGHSASTSTDFDIGAVTDPVLGYNNIGKYPALLMNGCSAGSFFLNTTIFGENWINTPNRGAVGVIAHSYLGFSTPLRRYSQLFYSIAFGDPGSFSKGLGQVQLELAQQYIQTFGASPLTVSHLQQMVLLGDPVVKLFPAANPDFAFEPGTAAVTSFDEEPITALSESIRLSFVVNNFGKAVDQLMKVKVTRTLNDNSTLTYEKSFPATKYRDTLWIAVPGNVANGYGNNRFTIELDGDQAVEELDESNNALALDVFIPLSGTQNLYPNDFAIVHETSVNLSIQHTDQLSGKKEFIIEIDSVLTFDSPFKQSFAVEGEVLASQQVNLADTDTTAYYWRSRLAAPGPNDSDTWDVSAFTYINNGPEGWAQIEFSQMLDNSTAGLVKDPILKDIEFESVKTTVEVQTFGASAGQPKEAVSIKVNGAEYNLYLQEDAVLRCRDNTINLMAFDRKTTQPYPGVYLQWNEVVAIGGRAIICGREPYGINSYQFDELTMAGVGIAEYVQNVADGDSVVMYTIGDPQLASWSNEVRALFGPLGISVEQLAALEDGEPAIIFARKGAAPGSAKVFRAESSPSSEQALHVSATVTGRIGSGTMSSTIIGPAQAWHDFLVNYSAEATDEIYFQVFGISEAGEETLLMDHLTEDTSLAEISTTMFPRIRINLVAEDETFVTAPKLSRWLVTYETVAEGLTLYRGEREAVTLNEGETWQAPYSFVNISDKSFSDSLSVSYEIVNPQTFAAQSKTTRVKAPMPGDTTTFTLPFSTIGQDGLNTLKVFVNPRVLMERNYDNNVIQLSGFLSVDTDVVAPVLDVTFDGRHIVNNEFVSPSPAVRISLWDNNPYLLKADTVGVTLLVARPCVEEECAFERIYFSSPEVQWSPETDAEEFTMLWRPQDLEDGTYHLQISASDANGNQSGSTPYRIAFQVRGETEVTLDAPHPNPFSTAADFGFILTGKALPTQLQVDIFNQGGRLVQTLEPSATSHFHIGRNSFQWNGEDDAGVPLPGGVYLYKMSLVVDGVAYQKTGKLIIVR